MRRSVIALVAAVVAVGVSPGASAHHTQAPCKTAGSKTLAQTSHARVWEKRVHDDPNFETASYLYGCLHRVGERVRIAYAFDDGYVESGGYDLVALAGRYAGFRYYLSDVSCKAACPPGYETTTWWLDVYDLRRKRIVRRLDAKATGDELVVTALGALAWLERLSDGGLELHASDADGERVLAGGVDPGSLRGGGQKVYWAVGGERQSARLR